VLQKHGFVFARQNGSHKIYKNSKNKHITVPFHYEKILHPKILKNILLDADIPVEEL